MSLRAPIYPVRATNLCRRVRLLPLADEVLVRIGDVVQPEDVIARASVPGEPRVVPVSRELGIEGDPAPYLVKKPGDVVRQGEALAVRKGILGLGRRVCSSPIDGVVGASDAASGEVFVNPLPELMELKAGMPGVVVEVWPQRGAIIEVEGVSVGGVASAGPGAWGSLRLLAANDEEIRSERLGPEHQGEIVVGGWIQADALARAKTLGVRGVVVGGMPAPCFLELVSASPSPSLSAIVIDRFGATSMDQAAFHMLEPYQGRRAVLLPGSAWPSLGSSPTPALASSTGQQYVAQVIVPVEHGRSRPVLEPALGIGARVRLARGANAGRRGEVVSEPTGWSRLPSGIVARAFSIRLEDGSQAEAPRWNLELVG